MSTQFGRGKLNRNPIRRSPIKFKAKEHKESAPWRTPKIRLDAAEWNKMRQYIIARAGYRCENGMDNLRCNRKISWGDMHTHHRIHRSLGGSDVKENLLGVCQECHALHHAGVLKINPHKDWIA